MGATYDELLKGNHTLAQKVKALEDQNKMHQETIYLLKISLTAANNEAAATRAQLCPQRRSCTQLRGAFGAFAPFMAELYPSK